VIRDTARAAGTEQSQRGSQVLAVAFEEKSVGSLRGRIIRDESEIRFGVS